MSTPEEKAPVEDTIAQSVRELRRHYVPLRERFLRSSNVVTDEELLVIRREMLDSLISLYRGQYVELHRAMTEKFRRWEKQRTLDLEKAKKAVIEEELPRRMIVRINATAEGGETGEENGGTVWDRIQALAQTVEGGGKGKGKGKRKKSAIRVGNTAIPLSVVTDVQCQEGRCKLPPLPLTKYCARHILSDPSQKLFVKCAMDMCENPVPINAVFGSYCSTHSRDGARKKRAHAETTSMEEEKKEEEDEEEEEEEEEEGEGEGVKEEKPESIGNENSTKKRKTVDDSAMLVEFVS
eukprot:TRINITY_DN1347_c0_g6_i1.p2 TRINITY_DN1347_c0_g6~~TRINITY_DN1347_c0_g6_i1.p2  ORF type:complete len:295 (+),score=117.03 TRINITY_DN1347_c0_g6_i1:1362-2246(+)